MDRYQTDYGPLPARLWILCQPVASPYDWMLISKYHLRDSMLIPKYHLCDWMLISKYHLRDCDAYF